MNAFDRAMNHLDKAFGFSGAQHQYVSRKVGYAPAAWDIPPCCTVAAALPCNAEHPYCISCGRHPSGAAVQTTPLCVSQHCCQIIAKDACSRCCALPMQDEGDKMMIVERGDLVFVFNWRMRTSLPACQSSFLTAMCKHHAEQVPIIFWCPVLQIPRTRTQTMEWAHTCLGPTRCASGAVGLYCTVTRFMSFVPCNLPLS